MFMPSYSTTLRKVFDRQGEVRKKTSTKYANVLCGLIDIGRQLIMLCLMFVSV